LEGYQVHQRINYIENLKKIDNMQIH